MSVRVCKILLVASCALYMTLIAFDNVVDFRTNFDFVQHVMRMDTVLPQNQGSWRAVGNPTLHLALYAGIIVWEILAAALIWAGAIKGWRARSDGEAFRAAKSLSVVGLTASLLLWNVAFVTVGGEWWMMWQSPTWNGVNTARGVFGIHGLVLLFLCQPEP